MLVAVVIMHGCGNTEKHAIRENNDYEDYLFLKCIYDAFKGKVGYRGLYMKVCELLENPMNPRKYAV